MTEGLDGAIQKEIKFQKANFNRLLEIDLRQDAILLSGILAYKGYPCNVTCQNQGVCIPRFNTFECKCLEGFSGKMCQRVNGRSIRNHLEVKKNSPQSIYFDGHTEMLLNEKTNDFSKIQSMIRFEIVFRPKSQNGLILFTGNNQFESYLYLALINGKLEYSFSLPNQKQTFYFQSKKKISKNFWSSVNYIGYGNLVTDGFIRLGGYRKIPSRLRKFLKIGFRGCIKEFKVDNKLINLIENNLNENFYPNLCSLVTFEIGMYPVSPSTLQPTRPSGRITI
ncbi:agrin [Brachionus plicatilis]|uniref:Agrin n=1 Tax=Brachionus plicatilis TaxID=10195 RepID=A0A3M7T644_BRAPC|nr:agrin [Brachionus plicatilis]